MKGSRGFSLLEILVAFSIMGIALGIVLRIFSSGVHTAALAEEYTVATQIAESLMASTGVETPLTEGEDSGVEDAKYQWRVSVEQLPELVGGSTLGLMQVDVVVSWGEDEERQRRIELTRVKTGFVQ